MTAGGVRRCFLVAESEKSIVGFAVGRATFIEGDTFAELESVAVLDSARRSGIGRALCTAIIDWAYSCKATSIELEVRSRREAPIALYGSLGFVESGRRSGYYRNPVDDAVLMRLILSQE